MPLLWNKRLELLSNRPLTDRGTKCYSGQTFIVEHRTLLLECQRIIRFTYGPLQSHNLESRLIT